MLPPDFSYTPPPFQNAGLMQPATPMGMEKEFDGGKGMPSLAPAIQPAVVQQSESTDWVKYETTQFSWDYSNEHIVGDKYKFQVVHRATNAMLKIYLEPGYPLHAKPGAMVSMSPSVDLRGQISFSCMKFLTGSEFAKSIYNGPGIVELAPPFLGDIMALRVHPNIGKGKWKTGTDAFLASTVGIENDYKSQTLTQAMFSGEGLFVYTFWGDGWLFLQSFGAIARKDLMPGEEYFVDNNHLVAWDCDYTIRRVASGGIISGISSREGLACKFTGPGTVLYQTRKQSMFAEQLKKSR